jgi:hypothetical protein
LLTAFCNLLTLFILASSPFSESPKSSLEAIDSALLYSALPTGEGF